MNQILVTKSKEYEIKKNNYSKIKKEFNILKTSFTIILLFSLLCVLTFMITNYKERKDLKSSISKVEKPAEEAMEEELIRVVLNENPEEELYVVIPKKNKSIDEMKAGDIVDKSLIKDETLEEYFCSYEIQDETYTRIAGKSYSSSARIPLDNLRYIKLLHNGFDGKVYVGELIVNVSIANDILEIFKALYKEGYQIEKMRLVDEYGASDEQSMEDNNTSAFNYRNVGLTSKLSKHAYGLAIDINPKQNPYVHADGTCEPASSYAYIDRNNENLEHMIGPGDLCYELFISYGFKWGGNWNGNKDYQHFYKI